MMGRGAQLFDLPLAKRVGARLRELRLDAEITQAELARRVKIHRPIVGRVERGVHLLRLEEVARYAAALELDVVTVLVCLDENWIAAGDVLRGDVA